MAKSEKPKIDLTQICPELAEAISEIEKVEKYFTPGVEPKAIQNTEVRFTFAEAKAIAATMLKLAEEKQEMLTLIFSVKIHNEIHPDDWPAIIHEKIDKILGIAARKGDADEKV